MPAVHIFQLKYGIVIAVAVVNKRKSNLFLIIFDLLVLKSYPIISLVAGHQLLTALPVWFISQVLMTWGSDTNEQPS